MRSSLHDITLPKADQQDFDRAVAVEEHAGYTCAFQLVHIDWLELPCSNWSITHVSRLQRC